MYLYYLYYFLFALMALLMITTILLDIRMLDCVNRKLPKDKQLSWWRRSSRIEASRLYKGLYPKGQLATAFWICFIGMYVVLAGIILTRPR